MESEEGGGPVEGSAASQKERLCSAPLLVLYINDSANDQVILQAAAKKAGVPLEFHVADSVEGGISHH